MLRKISPFLFIVVLGFTTGGCNKAPASSSERGSTKTDGEQKTGTSPSESITEKFTIKKDTLETHLTIPGELSAYQQVDLYAKVTGFVKELKVDIGSRVKSGQVLITLEAPEMMAQLSAAQSRLKSQEALHLASLANYNRLIETSKTPGTISPNDLEQAEAKKNSDLANLEAARASYKEVNDIRNYLVIRAPFDGTITARNVNIGAYVGPSGRGSELPVLTLQQQGKLRLAISIPEGYSGYLKQGDEVMFRVRSHPSENFKAKLIRFSGALDLRLRSQRAEADIENGDGKLLAGTIADVSTTLRSSPNGFIVPKTSVVSSAEGVFVIKVVNGKAERVAVKKGLEENDLVEVFGKLSENDTLLKKGSDEIKAGQEVK
jgi:membrane fusion protein (multidrug efflux system)